MAFATAFPAESMTFPMTQPVPGISSALIDNSRMECDIAGKLCEKLGPTPEIAVEVEVTVFGFTHVFWARLRALLEVEITWAVPFELTPPPLLIDIEDVMALVERLTTET